MSVLDKFLDAMSLQTGDEEDYYEDDFDDGYYEEEIKDRRKNRKEKKKQEEEAKEEPKFPTVKDKNPRTSSKVTPMRTTRKQVGNMEVCVIKPTSVEDAKEVTETLLSNRTVVLNVEGLELEVAQRIIDFTSGSCFAINGNLQKISNYIFIITPQSVDLSGDFLNIVDTFDTKVTIKTDY